ncbi:MAG: hypothetical protein HUJ76_13070, partial [Parasporobacterium sp.]|nr:hypothetical protein [Parasporobacterium sp.]
MADSYRELISSSYDGRQIRLRCEQYRDVGNNRSRVHWTLYSEGGNVNSYTIAPTTIIINGQQVYYKALTRHTEYAFPATQGSVSGDIYVAHNADGSKQIDISLSTAVYDWNPVTYQRQWLFIPNERYAVITSASDFTDMQHPTIKYSNPLGANATSLQICISFDSGATAAVGWYDVNKTGTSYTFNFTDEERAAIRRKINTGNTKKAMIILATTIGSTPYAVSQEVNVTIEYNEQTAPEISAVFTAVNGSLPAVFSGVFIKGKSKLKTEITALPKFDATIIKYASRTSGLECVGTNPVMTTADYLPTAGSEIPVAVTCLDSRQFSNAVTPEPTIKVYEYNDPVVSHIQGKDAI